MLALVKLGLFLDQECKRIRAEKEAGRCTVPYMIGYSHTMIAIGERFWLHWGAEPGMHFELRLPQEDSPVDPQALEEALMGLFHTELREQRDRVSHPEEFDTLAGLDAIRAVARWADVAPQMHMICFASDEDDHLTLIIHGREAPQATDLYYGNLLRCTSKVRAGVFHGVMHTPIWRGDLARFLPQIENLAARPGEIAAFESYETVRAEDMAVFDGKDTSREDAGSVYASVTADGAGRFEVHGHICDVQGRLNVLDFRWKCGRDALSLLAQQVRAALAALPVIGETPAEPGAAPDPARR
jgi:hypothetical protein